VLLSLLKLTLFANNRYTDLAQHPAIVLIPYQVSIMSIFEYYRMAIPMFVPSPTLLARWQMEYRILSELTWDMVFSKPKDHSNIQGWKVANGDFVFPFDPNNQFSEESIAYWLKWADFYMWPHIIQYVVQAERARPFEHDNFEHPVGATT